MIEFIKSYWYWIFVPLQIYVGIKLLLFMWNIMEYGSIKKPNNAPNIFKSIENKKRETKRLEERLKLLKEFKGDIMKREERK